MQLAQLSLALLLAAASAATDSTVVGHGEPFRDIGFSEALKAAASEDKPVFIDFFTTWCGPCKQLDRTTFKDPAVVAWLKESTIPIQVDAELEVMLAARYRIEMYPALVFINADGKVKGSMVGFKNASEFLRESKSILSGERRSDFLRTLLAEDPKDPHKHLALGQTLAREWSYAEAADQFLWCWDHGDEDAKFAFSEARASMLKQDIGRLRAYHKPLQAELVRRRDDLEKVVLVARADRHACEDFILMNDVISDRTRTLEVYDTLSARPAASDSLGSVPSFDARPILFVGVVDLLLAARRYADAVQGFGDVELWFEQRRKAFEVKRTLSDQAAAEELLRREVIVDTCQLYEALVGAGAHEAESERVVELLTAFDSGPKPWIELMYAAKRAGHPELQIELRAQALEKLPPALHKRIPRVTPAKERGAK